MEFDRHSSEASGEAIDHLISRDSIAVVYGKYLPSAPEDERGDLASFRSFHEDTHFGDFQGAFPDYLNALKIATDPGFQTIGEYRDYAREAHEFIALQGDGK